MSDYPRATEERSSEGVSYEEGPNLENQVEIRQLLIDDQKKLIKQQKDLIYTLTQDLVTVCRTSYELLIKAQISGASADEATQHLTACLLVLDKFTTKQRTNEVGEASDEKSSKED